MEETLVIIKPDAVQRGLAGAILKRFESKGLKITGLKLEVLKEGVLKEHYGHHSDKPFFPELIRFMTKGPSIVVSLSGLDAIKVVRNIVGATNGREASPGTIRGDFSMSNQNNLVHASEDKKAAQYELERFFSDRLEYNLDVFEWIYNNKEAKS